MKRLVLVLVGLLVFAGCSSALLPHAEVPDLVRDAFRSAGLKVSDVEVERTREGNTWSASATVDGDVVALEVDAEAGRVTSINLGGSDAITTSQLREIAGYASNPANDRARTRNRVLLLVTVVGLVSVGLLVARHFRVREERELAASDQEQ